jgi:hypothetical protein
MKSEDRNSANSKKRNENKTKQPNAAIENSAGYGDKKLDGPNRPST